MKAKEKLGDRNAFLVAELLQLQEFDEKNLKALCPYHAEDTPSFVYDKKRYCWHCFGCNKTVDLLDVLVGQGRTFLEACQFLFEKANMNYSFGEKNVQTRHEYKYPHEEPVNARENVNAYMKKRGITKNTLDYLDVREDAQGNCVFNYYDPNDVLTLVKYRPSHTVNKKEQAKTWCQKDADTTPLLFNMNRVNPQKPLLITEGECLLGECEVLTRHGWIQLKEYSGEEIMQIDANLHGSYVTPYAYIKKEYNGPLYTHKTGGNFSLTTTPGHNWVFYNYLGQLTKRHAEDMPTSIGGVGRLPTTIIYDGQGLNLNNDEIALWLAVSADGSCTERKEFNHIRISLKKERKILRLRTILNNLSIKYTETVPSGRPEYTYFGFRVPKYMTKEFPFSFVSETSLEQKRYILQEMVEWDGNNVSNRNQVEYSSKIYNNAVIIQSIAHTCGYMSTIMKRKNKFGEWYKASILLSKNSVSLQHGLKIDDNYSGFVYCVTVPTGMILVREEQHIAITGNCDAMSAIESGYLNTVSVPFGAGNRHWIEENWEWLEQFDQIVIWADNDAPGEEMRKDCLYRLGTWRTKYVQTPPSYKKENGIVVPINDINDCLQMGGKDFVYNLIAGAKDIPVTSVVDFADVKGVNVTEMDGIQTGIKPLDKELMKIFYGTLTILSGRPGSGKTSISSQIVAHCMDNGYPVFLYSKEMPVKLTTDWAKTIIAGRRNMEPNANGYMLVTPEAERELQEYYRGKLSIYKDEEPNDVESVMAAAEACVRKYGVKLVVLDNLMMIDLNCPENETNSRQKDFINRLIGFAGKYNVAVLLIAHPRKTQDSNTDIEMYDIMGTSAIINLAHRSIGLRRVSEREKQDYRSKWHKYDVVLTIIKDRLLGQTGKQMGLWYDLPSRRFYTDYSEYAYQYKWDKKTYFDKLEYVDRSKKEEFPA